MKWIALVVLSLTIGPSVQDLPSPGSFAPGNAGEVSEQRVGRMGDGTGGGLSVAPAGVTDLTARALSDSAIVLQWTEVRSSTTAIPRYVVRYGPLGAFQWTNGVDLLTTGCAAPIVGSNATGGKPHACVVWDLLPNQAYEFQMVAYTGVLNSTAVFGPLSNITRATTMQRVGPMLVLRPRVFLDTIRGVERVNVEGWGSWPVLVAPRFGDYRGTLEDSSGAILARGYLLLVEP